MESVWLRSFKQTVEAESEKISAKDYKFFHIKRLLVLAEKIDGLAKDCIECKNHKETLDKLAERMGELINGGQKAKSTFEKEMDSVIVHLKKKHDMYPANYFTYLYYFIGMLGGALGGAAVALIIGMEYIKPCLLVGWVVGLLAGKIYGERLDSKIKKDKRNI